MSNTFDASRYTVRVERGNSNSRVRVKVSCSSSILDSVVLRFDPRGTHEPCFWSTFFDFLGKLSKVLVKKGKYIAKS